MFDTLMDNFHCENCDKDNSDKTRIFFDLDISNTFDRMYRASKYAVLLIFA